MYSISFLFFTVLSRENCGRSSGKKKIKKVSEKDFRLKIALIIIYMFFVNTYETSGTLNWLYKTSITGFPLRAPISKNEGWQGQAAGSSFPFTCV